MVTTDGSSSSIKLNSQLFDGSSDVYSFKISSSSSHIIYRPVQDQALVTDLYSVQLEPTENNSLDQLCTPIISKNGAVTIICL